jgi:fatty acid synthase subunit alpha, fungi type
MQAIFLESVDGDLLKLVRLSNGFKILAITNNDGGKIVAVTGHALRDGEPVIKVRSSFLYRGRFSDYENTFQIVDEPDFVVELNDVSAVGVLQSKEWFET